MKKVSSKNVISALVAGTLLATGNMAMAATDGDLGASSTGTLNVIANLNPTVQITKLQDIELNIKMSDLGVVESGLTGQSNACIHNSNGGDDGDYQISASGDDGFKMSNDTGKAISYTVQIKDSDNAYAGLTHGSSKDQKGASLSRSCEGGFNATIKITANQTEAEAAGAGQFRSVLTLTVAPI